MVEKTSRMTLQSCSRIFSPTRGSHWSGSRLSGKEIVAAGGITAAAREDSNRQSQYSRQLKELEKHFGVELLKRGQGPAELTDAGQRLYEIIGHTLSALEEFRLICAGQPVELTIGAGDSLIQWLLLPRLTGLAAAHPRLAVTFQNLKTDEIIH